jgi:hypothetical protein
MVILKVWYSSADTIVYSPSTGWEYQKISLPGVKIGSPVCVIKDLNKIEESKEIPNFLVCWFSEII